MQEQFSKLMRDQFYNTLQNQMAAASGNYCNMESSNVASQGENVRLSGSYMREHSMPSSCNEGVSRVSFSERNWHTGGSSSVSHVVKIERRVTEVSTHMKTVLSATLKVIPVRITG